ncbi:hypothetical protein [Nesterenkonia flava]|uniref:Uncharacterized protein n=1 Tax=Nesterenkonia flava TaxID=469799 RepID=A0ABU1FW82_9MICC|nr:hypothetical protein [Nesterenkonia flava]MDR5712948.1 hypothetical protein [Nesterenkonia flava]
MSEHTPPLTKAQGEKLNALHAEHVIRAQKEREHAVMTCDLPAESPEGRAAATEAAELAQKTHRARTNFYAYVNQLTGGATGT